jgi:hypothetical protein
MQVRRTVAAIIFVLVVSLSLAAQQRRAIPEGTQVTIRIIDNLSSETAKEGDVFHATLEEPIVADGYTLFAKGTDVTGTITFAHSSGRLSDPGELELVLTNIVTNGRSYPISTKPWSLKGESHTKSNVGKIGGGAALGAIIGAVAGGGKGAAIGAGVGAGAGTVGAAATGKKDAKIESEALLSFVTLAPAPAQYADTPAARRDPEAPVLQARSNNDQPRSYDDPRDSYASSGGRKRPFRTEFTNYDRQNIRGCFVDSATLPAGLAQRESLSPGLEKQIERNGTLPPGLQKRAQPLPDSCNARLPRLPADWSRVVLGQRVLLLNPDGRITDQFNLDDEE